MYNIHRISNLLENIVSFFARYLIKYKNLVCEYSSLAIWSIPSLVNISLFMLVLNDSHIRRHFDKFISAADDY